MIEHEYDAAGGVVLDGDRVLVLDRSSRSETRLPKGHVEPGETDVEAAVREVGEESGYVDVRVERDLGMQLIEFEAHPPEGPAWHIVRRERYFLMRLVSDAQAPRVDADQKFVPRWVPAVEAEAAMTYDNEREWVRRALDPRA